MNCRWGRTKGRPTVGDVVRRWLALSKTIAYKYPRKHGFWKKHVVFIFGDHECTWLPRKHIHDWIRISSTLPEHRATVKWWTNDLANFSIRVGQRYSSGMNSWCTIQYMFWSQKPWSGYRCSSCSCAKGTTCSKRSPKISSKVWLIA